MSMKEHVRRALYSKRKRQRDKSHRKSIELSRGSNGEELINALTDISRERHSTIMTVTQGGNTKHGEYRRLKG